MVTAAAGGTSNLAVLVGSSSTGKTRACWEAIQPLATQGWHLWHPFEPTRATAALAELAHVGPKTVVWLNETQHSLGDPRHGEAIAAALRTLLTDPDRAPVLVLGTLWPQYDTAYRALPQPGTRDQHAQVRTLLASHTVTVPDAFDERAMTAARELANAGEFVLASALSRATDGYITQDLAGAPELLHRYKTASPAARAILHAAMDARRLAQQQERLDVRENDVAEFWKHLSACFGAMIALCTMRAPGCCRSPRSICTLRSAVTRAPACRCVRSYGVRRRLRDRAEGAGGGAAKTAEEDAVKGNAAAPFRPAIDGILTTDLIAPRKSVIWPGRSTTGCWKCVGPRSLAGACPERQAVHPRERAGVGHAPGARPGGIKRP